MCFLPRTARLVVNAFSVAFTRPTFHRFLLLLLGALLAIRMRTVTNLLRTLGPVARGHWSDFHRVLSRAQWSLWSLSRVLAAMILELIPPDQPIVIPVDDTTTQHRGKRVYGKGRHHDACRSTHSHVVWVWGHKWVVLAINVKFAFAARPWALPVLCALYRPKELNEAEGRRHRTPIRLAMQLTSTLIHWFPRRKFVLVGDGGYASHELARFCHRHRRHVTLVARFHSDARLYDAPAPKPKGMRGRPRLRGRRLAAPGEAVQRGKGRRTTVNWYGGQRRRVELISGCGLWYKGGGGVVPVRWVFVHDLDGTHREEYFYSTDQNLTPERIVSLYTGRWSIEVTFQEVRTHLGLTTSRNWSRNSVLRTTPCLFGLFSVVSLIFDRHTRGRGAIDHCTGWYAKPEPTFTDAIITVRKMCWAHLLKHPSQHAPVPKIPGPLRNMLLNQLARAA